MNSNTHITFIKEDPWRIFRIMAEFVDSFETLSQVGPGVTVFGSARMLPGNPYYKATIRLTRELAKHNMAAFTRRVAGRPGTSHPRPGGGGREYPGVSTQSPT